MAIDRPEFAVGIGPFIPDRDTVVAQIGDIGRARQKPQQLVDDRFEMQLLGGDQRKSLRKVEAHLPAEDRSGAGAGAIGFLDTVLENMSHQIVIGPHGFRLR